MYRDLQRLVCLFLIACCAAACGGGKGKGGGAGMMGHMKATVVTTTVKPASYTVTESFPASLTANNIVELRPDVSGYLEAIRVKDGSNVTRGQALYEIDKSRYVAALSQLNASVLQAQADLAQKQRDLDRYKNLLEHDAISRQTVEQAATALETSKANLAAAKAAVEKAGTDVNHAIVRAPVSGKIGIVQIKVGDIVNAGQTLINTIVNENPMYADFDIPQNRYRDFTGPDKSRSFKLRFADGTRYQEGGTLLTINNMVDPQTGTIRVRLQFPNSRNELKSGMTAIADLLHASSDTALAIPAKAIMETLAEKTVYVIGPGNVITSRPVKPGPIVDSLQIIYEGLKAGDQIVVDGLQKARPGDTVNIAPSH